MAVVLERNYKDRVIGGVCSGFARYFDISPIWLRILFLILLVTGGGLLVYIILWIALPSQQLTHHNYMENAENQPKPAPQSKPNSGSIIAGVILISLGAFFLLKEYIPDLDFSKIWPYVLIGAGVFLLLKGMQKN